MNYLTLTRPQGNNQALVDGTIVPAGFPLQFAHEPVLAEGFRKMVRGLEYDVSEMALTSYLCARERGVRFTALPIFPVRGFHHGAIQVLRDGGITDPNQLTGGRVGVNRGYTVTTGVWARAILASDYGLDLDSVTWMRTQDEHVADYRPPRNVIAAPADRTLVELLKDGELDAIVGVSTDDPDVVTLISNPEEAAFAALRDRGLYPINHLIVVKDEVLNAQPQIVTALFTAFTESKTRYVDLLRDGGVDNDTDRMYARVLAETGADPLPYGVEPNRAVLEQLVDQAVAQHILDEPVSLERVFAPTALDLIG